MFAFVGVGRLLYKLPCAVGAAIGQARNSVVAEEALAFSEYFIPHNEVMYGGHRGSAAGNMCGTS